MNKEKKYTRIKICGITNLNDALIAVHAGADAVGFIFAPSKRRIDPVNAHSIIQKLLPFVSVVGVFMNQCMDEIQEVLEITGIEVVQLHGQESPEFCEKIQKIDISVRTDDKERRFWYPDDWVEVWSEAKDNWLDMCPKCQSRAMVALKRGK